MITTEEKIVLPASMDSFFSESGYCESTFYESRKNSRLRIRCKATMTFEQSLPCVPRLERETIVYVKDISRRGIGIMAHTQLFPEEKVLICFQQREVLAKIVRCQRKGELCWECGALIIAFKNLEEDFA
jgi:PilZ domain